MSEKNNWSKEQSYTKYCRYWINEFKYVEVPYREEGDWYLRHEWVLGAKIGPFPNEAEAKKSAVNREKMRKEVLSKLEDNRRKILEEIIEPHLFFRYAFEIEFPSTKYELQKEEKVEPK